MHQFAVNSKRRKSYTNDELIQDVIRCAKKIGKETITREEYDSIPGINHSSNVAKRFKGWIEVLKLAGLNESRSQINIPEEDLLKNLFSISEALHRLPVYQEIKSPISKYSAKTYENRFGSWNNALDKFENWLQDDKNENFEIDNEVISNGSAHIKHKTKRTISDRLRFRILMRDGFTCQSCGASPSKKLGTELHVDHKIPWSLGGETIPDNLITKCQQCNLGKGNAFIE